MTTSIESDVRTNISHYIPEVAARLPKKLAVICPNGDRLTFEELDQRVNQYARGLLALGIGRGTRTLLMVKPSADFFPLVFALFKVGAVLVLVDPGLGRKNLLEAIEEVAPEAMIGIPLAHVARTIFPGAFRSVTKTVTVGPRLWWGGIGHVKLRSPDGSKLPTADTGRDETAAVLFTSGSTGAPKGVVYTHGIFDAQTRLIGGEWGIGEDEVDLPAFPPFALFSCALGVTSVIPDMDPTRPAMVDPPRIVAAIERHGVTYSFGSPAFWNRVSAWCLERNKTLPTLRRVFVAGAPVQPALVDRIVRCLGPAGDVYIPYGATESLPVARVSGREVLSERARTEKGGGTCVGRPLAVNEVKVIKITEAPIPTLDAAEVLPPGEIGEIMVRGPVVTRAYYRRPGDDAKAKVHDGEVVWHRMGDVGYLEPSGRLWFCGRKAHRVETRDGPMYTIPTEAIFNVHPSVFRTALVGVGPAGDRRPVIVVEPKPGRMPRTSAARDAFVTELRALASGAEHPLARRIETFLFHRSFPVDVRHNAKIFREKLAVWAGKELDK